MYDKIVSEKYVNSVFSEHPKTKMTVRKFKVDESSRQTSSKLQQNFKISITKFRKLSKNYFNCFVNCRLL